MMDPEDCAMISVIETEKAGAGLMARLGGLLRDRRGSGAVEFAIITPILLMLYITCFELTIGFSFAKRTTRAAGSVADIITQQTSVTKAKLATMLDVASAIFAPYSTTGIKIKITGITIDAAKKATVTWSWAQDGTKPYVAGTVVTVPKDMNGADTFLVHTELSVPHELLMFMPSIGPSQTKTITIAREYYYRNRLGTTVSCAECL